MSDERDEHQREQDRVITVALYAAQWKLETVAHHLPANDVTPEAWAELLEALDQLRELVRMRSDHSGPPTGDAPPTLYPEETD